MCCYTPIGLRLAKGNFYQKKIIELFEEKQMIYALKSKLGERFKDI